MEVILCREEMEQDHWAKAPGPAEKLVAAVVVVALEQAPMEIAFVQNVGKKYLIVWEHRV